ncbi:MAG: hypothetical protein WA892_03440, partial [Ornithinimicrobium sp.]
LPVNLAATLALEARVSVSGGTRHTAEHPRTVLLTGGKMTKALHLARAFHRAGHRVVLVESGRYRLTGHRFSRAVDAFHVVPAPQDPGYVAAVVAVAEREGAEVFVPLSSPVSSAYDSQVREALAGRCDSVHVDPPTLGVVDDKGAFARAAADLGLPVPDTHLITDPAQVLDFDFSGARRPYVLKSIAYDPVHRLDLTPLPWPTRAQTEAFVASLPISAENPWILQELIAGPEYCTHGTARDGELTAYCCCESSAFQVNYEHVDKPEIERWVRTFVRALGATGQLSFDFIETVDGTPYAIECNPRTHSAITLFDDPVALAHAYLDAHTTTLTPPASAPATYWLYHELWRLLRAPWRVAERWQVLRSGRDAIFDPRDPLPFLLVHHLQVPSLLLGNLLARRDWLRIDFNIGKLVEPAGD